MDLTAIILAKNEELNISDCIKSLDGFASRVLVIDSFSSDKTVEIAKNLGAEVILHPYESYAKQLNWAIENTNITTKWTLRFDADERMTPELCKELTELAAEHENDDVNGVVLEAWLYFLDKKIKHGCHNKRKLMLFKTGLSYCEDRNIDEHNILRKGRSVNAKNRFIHYDFKGMTEWTTKMNRYATAEVQDYFDYKNGKGQEISESGSQINSTRKNKFGVYYKFPKFLRCWLLFIFNYIFRLGFLDGAAGFVYNFMYHYWYRALVDSKILEAEIAEKKAEK